ncbi:MAG: aldose 1-epimerase family protein [Saccharofermentanales bacterium]
MKILGKSYDERTLMKYSGSLESLNSARRIQLQDGKAKGTDAIDVRCSSGLDLMILIDRGMDIVSASYRGVNISYLSKNGITGNTETNPFEDEFLRYFTGGLLTTCGLRNTGPSCRDTNGEYHPLHGRINTICAQEVSIQWTDKETLVISGVLRETALFGHQLKLKRTITINASTANINLCDELENETETEEEFAILYHFNFGFPFLQDGCRVEFEGNDKVTPRSDEAKKGIGEYQNIIAPVDGYKEQVFFHLLEGDVDGNGSVRVVNPHLQMKAEMKYSLDTLPILAQWKSMKSGDYVLGIEPSNSYISGRVEERKNGTLKKIAPYSKMKFCVDLTISTI